jgi:hypothetical protein
LLSALLRGRIGRLEKAVVDPPVVEVAGSVTWIQFLSRAVTRILTPPSATLTVSDDCWAFACISTAVLVTIHSADASSAGEPKA